MSLKKAIKKINLPSRASIGYIGAGIVGKTVGILTTPIFTSLIDKEGYGLLTLYMSILGASTIIISSVTSSGAIYRGFKQFGKKINEYTSSALAVSFAFSLLICILLFTFIDFLGLKRSLMLPLCLQIFCDTAIGVILSRSRFGYRYLQVILCTLISSVLPPLISIFYLTRYGGGYEIKIYTLLIVSLIIAITLLAREILYGFKISFKMCRDLIKKALPFLPKSISSALLSGADKLFISSILGYAALAKYSVAHSVGIALQFIVSASSSALGPWMTRRLDAKDEGRIREVLGLIFSILCATGLGIAAIAPEAIDFLAPKDYTEASYAVTPIALSVPIAFLCYALSISLVNFGKGRFSAVASIIGSFSCVAFNMILIPYFGFIGAGCALLLSEGITLLLSLYFAKNVNAECVIPKKWYNTYILSLLVGVGIMLFQRILALRIIMLIIPAIIGLRGMLEVGEIIKEH